MSARPTDRESHRRKRPLPSHPARTLLPVALMLAVLFPAASAQDRQERPGLWPEGKDPGPQRTITLDGKYVHNVGDLQMNVTNWGFLGSLPGSRYPMSDSPSAQWPAGSGVEYLYAAGLWVGALLNGNPVVSTGYPETEFYPTTDPRDVIYRASEGDPHGASWPSWPDDDGDGLFDEDWLNGIDDDGDGLIDEDFAARGTQMFSCWYTDDQEMASTIWPEHTPMGLTVRQETYQWSGDYLGNMVVVRYFIKNTGENYLQDVWVGMYADLDAGPRNRGSYYRDDMIGMYRGIECAQKGGYEIPVSVYFIYVRDDDGDDGQTLGYFGLSWIEMPIYSNESSLPGHSWANFALHHRWYFNGLLPFERGGEPTNDFQRYELMSGFNYPSDTPSPGDYRVLYDYPVTPELAPGEEFIFTVAFIAGKGLPGIRKSAAASIAAYQGLWADVDQDPETGIEGRESKVWGPAEQVWPDPCNRPDWIIEIPAKTYFYCNLDCSWEHWLLEYNGCYKKWDADLLFYMTGVDGKETHIPWVVSSAPVPPHMRLVPGDGVVTVLWDNRSEQVPDQFTLEIDFEGYDVYRADDWHRPYGTTRESGPSKDLWSLLDTGDLLNNILPNREFKKPFEEGGWEYTPLPRLEDRQKYLEMFEASVRYNPLDSVPCPPGLTEAECDTLEALARYKLGMEGGHCYYRYDDRTAKNGLPYYYSVVAYDYRELNKGVREPGLHDSPASNFQYIEARSEAQELEGFESKEIYVVPNPVSAQNMDPWRLEPNNSDPTGLKCEFRNLPRCRSTVRIFTISGDLVQILYHDGRDGNGTLIWDLLSRNGQDVISGVYLFSVEPSDGRFPRTVGKFVVIR